MVSTNFLWCKCGWCVI